MEIKTAVSPEGRAAIPHGTLVVVCDSERGRFFENVGSAKEPKLEAVSSFDSPNPRSGEQVTDRPGRFNDGASPHRSAVEEPDHHELQKQRFAQQLAHMITAAAHEGAFRRLALVAGPKVLGELRTQLPDDVRQRVILELDKNLSQQSVEEIRKALLAAPG